MTDPDNVVIDQSTPSCIKTDPSQEGGLSSSQTESGCPEGAKDEEADWDNPEYRTAEFRM